MKQEIKYLSHLSIKELNEEVNSYLEKKWKIYGDIIIILYYNYNNANQLNITTSYIQTIVFEHYEKTGKL